MKIVQQAGKIHRRVRGERREEKPLEDRSRSEWSSSADRISSLSRTQMRSAPAERNAERIGFSISAVNDH